MIRKILLTLALLAVSAYLVVAVTAFNREPAGRMCHDIRLVIKDSVSAGFVTREEVVALLEKKGVNPIGKPLERVRTETLEKVLNEHPLIERTECYLTPAGHLCVEVSQRIPILRVMGDNGENYYIDNKGSVIPPEARCVAHLAVATGKIEKSFAMRDLYKFAVFLQQNSFWRAQVEQIHVLPDSTLEVVPRVGDHVIYLGQASDFKRKLGRVEELYRKGLNRVGWNKYGRINVEFDNQIICTKR